MDLEQLYSEQIEQFGLKLKSLRKKNQMSQLDLEVATGINHSHISRIENGKLNIEFFTMVKLAAALNGELVDFFK